ncbi:AB-hydrolase associated lipase region containing protein [Tieghemostelium lacteum]|uniref:AB-hydrolase associated lipase region containing protein n=1 Tax=Tieghemostelium lacteum TaxID=361077 RepID=A0A151ZEV9_TIELA|nr:AB-hydrolase associated lipase region containing protein [Tieghemostelium lacteum]|eukprot:KYQ92457.1 AB-hydrolase associated lipase region containing protein [Tieghemostelium lacteum]
MLIGFRVWLANQISSSLDNTLISLNETLKTFIEEVWQLGSQLANILTLAILGLFYKPGYQNYWEQKNRIKKGDPKQKSPKFKSTSPKLSPSLYSSSGGGGKSKLYRSPKKPSSFAHLLNEYEYENSSTTEDDIQSSSGSGSGSVNSQLSPTTTTTTSPISIPRTNSLTNISGSLKKRKSLIKPNSLASPQYRLLRKSNHHIKKDMVHFHEQITTGLLEDIRTNLLLFFDAAFGWLRSSLTSLFTSIGSVRLDYLILLIISLPIYLPYYTVKAFLWPFIMVKRMFSFWKQIEKIKQIPNKIISDQELDIRSVKEIIEQAGYPYESYQVTTEDGYILLLERIPNKASKNVLYLQHGIFDNSFAWVATGPSQSIAFAAHDQGYDVFLTNLRGNGQRLHKKANISSKDYWNFSMNEHAFLDTPAFIQKIRSLKSTELPFYDIDQLNIIAIAHSMGAGILLMYIVKCGLLGVSHHLKKAILMSPAGYHKAAPKICDLFAPLLNIWLFLFPMYVFKFPSETLRIVIAKIYHDVISNAPTKELLTYLASRYLLGGDIVDHPLTKIHNLTYNTFNGTSVKLYKHFWQLRKSCKFQTFDYGSAKKNMDAYGTKDPIDILDNYQVIDIPIHFIMGLKDNLIHPSNILKHYNTLKKHHPNLAFLKASKNGHIEFTLGLDDQIRSYVLNILNSSSNSTLTEPESGNSSNSSSSNNNFSNLPTNSQPSSLSSSTIKTSTTSSPIQTTTTTTMITTTTVTSPSLVPTKNNIL